MEVNFFISPEYIVPCVLVEDIKSSPVQIRVKLEVIPLVNLLLLQDHFNH